MKKQVQSVTTRKTTYVIDPDRLVQLLYEKGLIEASPDGPVSERVYTRVPEGGDWSGMDIVVGEDTELRVEIVETIRTEEES